MTQIAAMPRALPARQDRNYWFMYFLGCVLLVVRLLFPPEVFADFDNYVGIADQLRYHDGIGSFILEPASKLPIYLMGMVLPSFDAITVLSYINTFVFMVCFFVLVGRKKRDTLGMVLLAGMYVPVMAFVVLRAMPAYLIAAYAVERFWDRGEVRPSLWLCMVAAAFHFSAVLVVPPLLVAYYYTRRGARPEGLRAAHPLRDASLLGVASLGLAFVFPSLFGTLLSNIIPVDSIIGKYAEYLTTSNSVGLAHRVYYLGILALSLLFYYRARSARQRLFVAASLMLFSLLSLSPVVAYRYSLYFTIAFMLNMPPVRFTLGRAYTLMLALLMGWGFFALGVWQITHLT